MTTSTRVVAIMAVVALVIALTARVVGPSDAWDQTQPKTIGYTADMLVNGEWLVPRDREIQLATKPPLYNWLAAPVVGLVGLEHEWAHKLPSIVALILTCGIVVVAGRRLGPRVGWMAMLMLSSSYFMFKLGYLARPDMVLVLLLTIAWVAGTNWVLAPNRAGSRVVFWITLGFAGLVKGPVSLLAVLYLLVACRVLGGSFRQFGRSGWWWGLPLAMVPFMAWLLAVWRADPAFVTDHLWANEVWGRVVGQGTESAAASGWVESLPHMPSYVLTRFAPWSLVLIVMVAEAIIRFVRRSDAARRDPIVTGAMIYLLIFILIFTLSVGKRADYLAPAIPAAAIGVAWWLEQAIRRWSVPLVGVASALSLTTLIVVNQRQDFAPSPDYGDVIKRFTLELAEHLETVDRATEPVVACWVETGPVPPMVGVTREVTSRDILDLIDAGEPFWVIAGLKTQDPRSVHDWLAIRRPRVVVRTVLESPERPRSGSWLEQVRLYRIEP